MADQAILENRKLRMKGPLPETQMFIKAARVDEGLSKLTEMTVDFMSPDRKLDLGKVVGKSITVKIMTGEDASRDWREFVGTCVEAQYIGLHEGYGYYSLEVRPWLWFLTRTRNNRIFQDLNAIDIIKKVLGDHGFADFTVQLSRTPDVRVYTVQYNESDYDFICRLMEEEGIYFYSTVKASVDHLMIVDDIGAHSPVEDAASIKFFLREATYRRNEDHVFEWRGAEAVTPGKVTLKDWNFEKPKADLKTAKALPRGGHSHKGYELYRYPGSYRETALGDIYARIEMEANAAEFQVRHGIGNVRTLATGATFKLTDHFRDDENQDYLILSGIHMMQIEPDATDESQEVQDNDKVPHTITFEKENRDVYRCMFSALPKATPFRAKRTTPWPRIPGILIAKVTGPKGEEIYTDKYGRIKVQFPWDRDGKNDEKTTCWVRVTTPWSGKNWGMIHVPRIGQEVVIQFEDGDPDRPICTGMLYNADTMPPYALPDNMTQSGIKTNSSKGGDGFNELMMEDKKGEELVRLQSEKDYVEIIKNNATITIGMEKKDPGDLTQTIYANKTETIKTGDMTFTVETGSEHRDIKTDKNEKIGANSDLKVDGNVTAAVKGDQTHETKGKFDEKVTGSFSSDVTGSVTIESKQKIVLKVGGNSIAIDQSGITIKGIMIETKASGMATHKASGIMVIQGSLVNIN
ncbi:type VI secretion system Vgr family protein [Pseudorhodobacter sp.]|uniref:type VI secretion system Vgr family protein n=1 Tax=Pseudorhodobacter sp. TaxID=1934400 RepID=UPI002AFECB9E|nr:type VI secretion system tip protein TssI/VgrG [Pseudorhodobacter sp.]